MTSSDVLILYITFSQQQGVVSSCKVSPRVDTNLMYCTSMEVKDSQLSEPHVDRYHKELLLCFGVDGVSNRASLDCFLLFYLCFDYSNEKCAESMNYHSLSLFFFKNCMWNCFLHIYCLHKTFFWRLDVDDG